MIRDWLCKGQPRGANPYKLSQLLFSSLTFIVLHIGPKPVNHSTRLLSGIVRKHFYHNLLEERHHARGLLFHKMQVPRHSLVRNYFTSLFH